MTREETIHELGEWLEQMVQHGVPSHSAKRKALVTAIGLLSAEAVQGWVPCSERLPSESDNYLCTIPLDADETYTEVLTFHKGRFYEDDDEWGATYHYDVLAWMPLPAPYKGGGEE